MSKLSRAIAATQALRTTSGSGRSAAFDQAHAAVKDYAREAGVSVTEAADRIDRGLRRI